MSAEAGENINREELRAHGGRSDGAPLRHSERAPSSGNSDIVRCQEYRIGRAIRGI